MADFHDINSPGEYRAKTDEPQQTNQVATATDEEEPQQQKPAEPEICLLSATFEPDKVHGYSLNKGCRVTGTAEFLKDTSMTKVTLKLYAVYDGTEEDLQINQAKYGTANINKKDNTFTFPDVPLYNPTGYPDRDGFKTPVTYKAVISATRAKKPLECTLELPQESTPVPPLLQKDMYDDKATEKYPSKYQKGGKGYVEGTPIFDYQQVLEQLNYLPKGTANGVFGPKTDEATRAFQTDSTGKRRVKKSSGKLVEAEKITYTDVVDGIVGQKTRDELSVWQTNNYLRPLPNLYHGDFDKEAVQKGIKDNPRSNTSDPVQKSEEENGDDYHDVGTPVLEAQKQLKDIDAYDGALDGWFFDKMRGAVELLQEYAEKGEFLVDGVKSYIGEKLSGHRRGTLDSATQDYIKKVEEKGGKVPKTSKVIKKGDKGKIVEEINIRLAGFGGGVPADTFDDVTEAKVKNFQRDYMKMDEPTGIVDEKTAEKIDEFGNKFAEKISDYKCPCTKCGGFGKGQFKRDYRGGSKLEKYHKYEYPGIHRSLLWLIMGLRFRLTQETNPELKIGKISSAYRCWIDNKAKKRTSTNHMGKAADLHIYLKSNNGNWVNGGKSKCDYVRNLLIKHVNAQVRWAKPNKFSLEPSEASYKGEFLATTWVHVDVRNFEQSAYLQDRFFAKTDTDIKGKAILKLIAEEKCIV